MPDTTKAVDVPTTEQIRTMNIYEKMLRAQTEIKWVKKNLTIEMSEKNKYKAVAEADVIEAVKPIEERYRIWSYPFENEITESGTITDKNGYNKIWMRVRLVTRFVNIDNPTEYVDITNYGDGIDSGDKAPGKATTYAAKYGWLKGFKIQTGDDPDGEPSPEDLGNIEKAPKKTTQANDTGATEYVTEAQLGFMKKLFTEIELAEILDYYKIDSLAKITKNNASRMIEKKKSEGNK